VSKAYSENELQKIKVIGYQEDFSFMREMSLMRKPLNHKLIKSNYKQNSLTTIKKPEQLELFNSKLSQ